MRKFFIYSMVAAATMLFGSCGHSHEHEAGDGHNHGTEAHEGEGHEHSEDEHAHEGEGKEGGHSSDEIVFTAEQAKAAGLQVITLKPETFAEVIEVSGRVLPTPGGESTVTATMAGIVRMTANLTEGTPVSAGQGLFVVNGKAMADGNPAAVAQAELKAAKAALERAEKLAAEKIIAKSQLEAAQQRYQAALATANSLGGANQTRGMSAPMGGYVKSLLVKNGDYVSAGQALATITQSRKVTLRADVPERYYSYLPRITSANFRMAADKGDKVYSVKALGGRLLSKGQAAADGDFFVPVTFEFNNQGTIVTGSLAQVYLQGAPRQGVLAVPTTAIIEMQGVYYVYLQIEPDAYMKQEVTLGATDGQRTEIVSGLKAGDKVVGKGATQVRLAGNSGAIPHGHSH